MMAKRERLCWFLGFIGMCTATVFLALTNMNLLKHERLAFSGAPSRGVFVPAPSNADIRREQAKLRRKAAARRTVAKFRRPHAVGQPDWAGLARGK